MCVCIHTGTQGWRAGEDKCSRHVRSKSLVCVDKWRQCCFQSMVPDLLGGYCKVKATFTCVDIRTDPAKAMLGNIAGAFARIEEWHVTILVVTVFPTAMHSPFKKKKKSTSLLPFYMLLFFSWLTFSIQACPHPSTKEDPFQVTKGPTLPNATSVPSSVLPHHQPCI